MKVALQSCEYYSHLTKVTNEGMSPNAKCVTKYFWWQKSLMRPEIITNAYQNDFKSR